MRYWWLYLARYAWPQWPGLTWIGVATLLGIGVKLLQPWPLKLIVDHVLTRRELPGELTWLARLPGGVSPHGLLAWLAAGTVLLFLLRRTISISQKYVEAGTGARMTYALATDLFAQLQQRSLTFHSQQRAGDLVRRVTADCTCVRDLVMNIYLPLVTALLTLVSMFFVMWRLSPAMALLAAGLALPLGLVTRWFAGPMSRRRFEEMELQGEVMAQAEQTLTAIPIVQAFGREDDEDRRFRGLTKRTIRASLRTLLAQEWFKVSTGGLTSIAVAVVMGWGGMAVLRGEMTVGTVLVLLAYFGALYSPIETLAYLGAGFATAGAGARRVMQFLTPDQHSVRERPGAHPLPPPVAGRSGRLRVEQVSFGYQADRPVLRDVSFEAAPGEVLALVGPTGAGKSTLAALLARLHDPWTGSIQLDGHELRDVTLRSLRQNVAMVLQEPFLFPASVAENIAYGRIDASREEIVAAAEAAGADRFIRKLPQGYDTRIGERGETLSGGERQRLSIARALLKDAPVLILDEPTASLDARTEAGVLAALQRLIEGRTTFMIAHRLSTIQRADRILVLDQGRLVETGSHAELVAAGGLYAQLVQLQQGKSA